VHGGWGTAPLAVLIKKQLLALPYGADDEYDYIGAYMGSDLGSPVQGEYGGGGQGGCTGYGEGRFATNLEGLR